MKQLLKKREALVEALAALDKQIKKAKGEKFISCEHCNKRRKVKKLIYIQTFHYTEPYGCTGGDYWTPTEGQYICPDCKQLNRLYDSITRHRLWIADYEDHFALVVEQHSTYARDFNVDRKNWESFKLMWKQLYNEDISDWDNGKFVSRY